MNLQAAHIGTITAGDRSLLKLGRFRLNNTGLSHQSIPTRKVHNYKHYVVTQELP